MGKATSQSVRASILRAFAEKKSYRQIAAMHKVNEQTVRQNSFYIWFKGKYPGQKNEL